MTLFDKDALSVDVASRLRGHLEYHVENQTFDLEPGDNLIFATHLRHRWRNVGSSVTNALIVLSDFSEGERVASMKKDRCVAKDSTTWPQRGVAR